MSSVDFPDWVRTVVIQLAPTPPASLAAVTLSPVVGNVSTKLIDASLYPHGIVEWSMSLQGALEGVWLAYGQPAVPGFGIELTSPGAVSDSAWNGDVFGIASTGGFHVGVQIVYIP